ncbi:hypothetical protein K438DRAFT_2104391 [Mycena galopus ATCC 62051]|nr:hypothetical protein K438DRAFT_2104391 [Mycena galopus ATCC 62051]
MKLILIFVSLFAIWGVCRGATSVRQRTCSNATVTGRSSFIANEGHEIQISILSCADAPHPNMDRSDSMKRQAVCAFDTRDDCDQSNIECSRDNQVPSPPSFQSDCNTLILALESFTPDFSVLASQMIEVTFAHCAFTLTAAAATSGICADEWAEAAETVLDRCAANNEGGDTTCSSGLFEISVSVLFG